MYACGCVYIYVCAGVGGDKVGAYGDNRHEAAQARGRSQGE
jgi:hypothetical protein